MTPLRAAGITTFTAAVLVAVGALSQAAYEPPGGGDAVLRLSWRFRGERVETCRARTPAELEALPVHMRTAEVCEGGNVAYRVIMRVDDGAADTAVVLPGGARGDRPIFVLRESGLRPGERRIRVWFEPVESGSGDSVALHIDTRVDARPGVVHLITLDATGTTLVHRSGGG